MKRKTTRKKPVLVVHDPVEILRELIIEHKDLALCIDIMYMNGLPMFMNIDQTIHFRAAVLLENRSTNSLYDTLDKVFHYMNQAGS